MHDQFVQPSKCYADVIVSGERDMAVPLELVEARCRRVLTQASASSSPTVHTTAATRPMLDSVSEKQKRTGINNMNGNGAAKKKARR